MGNYLAIAHTPAIAAIADITVRGLSANDIATAAFVPPAVVADAAAFVVLTVVVVATKVLAVGVEMLFTLTTMSVMPTAVMAAAIFVVRPSDPATSSNAGGALSE